MAENDNKEYLSTLTAISSIATRFTAIIVLLVAIHQLYTLVGSAKGTLDALKLQAYDKVIGILVADSDMQRNQSAFLSASAAERLEKAFDEFLQKNGTGQQFYWSEQGRPFSQIAEHYERLGAIVKLNYLEFDIIFEIIPFPDDFWKETAGLRRKIRANWSRDKEKTPPNLKALPDLLENFKGLCDKYKQKRAERGYSSAKGMNCDL